METNGYIKIGEEMNVEIYWCGNSRLYWFCDPNTNMMECEITESAARKAIIRCY